MKSDINEFKFKENIVTVATLRYDQQLDKFQLLVKYKVPVSNSARDSIIALDPGIRTPFTGYSNNKTVMIGEECKMDILRRLNQIDRVNRDENLTKGERLRLSRKLYEKIQNRVTDFQWKTVNYLTSNFKTILIGNFSTKDMGESNTVRKMTKRIGNMYNMFQFKQKLSYKCKSTCTYYRHVNEAFTSKCCNRCGNYKKNLGGNEIYYCSKCHHKINRDSNGSMNILVVEVKD